MKKYNNDPLNPTEARILVAMFTHGRKAPLVTGNIFTKEIFSVKLVKNLVEQNMIKLDSDYAYLTNHGTNVGRTFYNKNM
jgi:hypothetical protein